MPLTPEAIYDTVRYRCSVSVLKRIGVHWAPQNACPAFMFYTQLFILENRLVHFWKIKKVGNGHIQPYCKAVQSSESNILCLPRHNVLYARDYDKLMDLLRYEMEHGGKVVWLMEPAFAFDYDARRAMGLLIDNGYAQGLLAGNALATHDLEGALIHTALGQDIYTQVSQPNGHYNHLDVINKVRRNGSIPQFIKDYNIDNGIIYSCVKNNVPFVLAGSIRDDGPLPEVYGDAYEAAAAMRDVIRDAMIIPEDFEPPVRILRATIPGIESQSKFRILLLVDYLPRHYL